MTMIDSSVQVTSDEAVGWAEVAAEYIGRQGPTAGMLSPDPGDVTAAAGALPVAADGRRTPC